MSGVPEFKDPSDWEDKTVGMVLLAIALGAVAAILLGWRSSGSKADLIDAVVKCAGGVIVLLGAYFTARTLKQSRAEHRLARMQEAIKMTGDDHPSVALGGMLILNELARTSDETRGEKRQAVLVRAVLAELAASGGERAAPARRVLDELSAPPKQS